MKPPNQFELAHAAEVLRRLEKHIDTSFRYGNHFYDLYLLSGAADTIDSFIENENLTFFKEIPDGNTEIKKTSTPTPNRETDAAIKFADEFPH